ncbi:MAG: cytochrome c3 family protein [Planctomycetota bacterium]
MKILSVSTVLMLFTCIGLASEDKGNTKQPFNVMGGPVDPTAFTLDTFSWRGHTQSCVLCHVPGYDISDADGIFNQVLWNYKESQVYFRMYVSLAGNKGTLDGTSRLCLSCHDGVIANDNYGKVKGSGGSLMGGVGLETDLTDDHPIGIEYPPTDQHGGFLKGYFNPPLGNVKLEIMKGMKRVECTSCHDPHGSPYKSFLRNSLQGSSICLKCHDK